MNFKDKMMDRMMGNMSAEEKKDMMDKMMDGFFSTMSKEEKQDMMNNMMPKMMTMMMGDDQSTDDNPMMRMMGSQMGGKMPMMGMMESMMGGSGKTDKASSPMDMCKEMMSKMSQSSDIAAFATPEVRQLFEDWVQQVDEEILDMVQTDSSLTPEKIAEKLKITKNSVLYFLNRLAQKGKITLNINNVNS